MRTVDGTELARSGCKMFFRGALRDVQDLADLPGGLALRGPGDHLAFARREESPLSGTWIEQAANAIEAVHRHQVQRRLASRIEIEMHAAQRNARLITGQPVDRH